MWDQCLYHVYENDMHPEDEPRLMELTGEYAATWIYTIQVKLQTLMALHV